VKAKKAEAEAGFRLRKARGSPDVKAKSNPDVKRGKPGVKERNTRCEGQM